MWIFLKQPSRLRDENKCLWILRKAHVLKGRWPLNWPIYGVLSQFYTCLNMRVFAGFEPSWNKACRLRGGFYNREAGCLLPWIGTWFFSFISSIFYLLSSLPDMALWESKYDGMGWSYALQYPFVRNSIPSEPVDYRRVSTFAQILSWKILLSCKDVSPVTRPPEPGTAMNKCFRRFSFFRIICVFLGSVIAPEM